MAKLNQNFDLYKGNTRQVEILLDSTTPDLTGGSATWMLGTGVDATGTEIKLTKTPVISQNADNLWLLSFMILATDLNSVDVGEYSHEARVTESNGKVHTVTLGTVKIKATMGA